MIVHSTKKKTMKLEEFVKCYEEGLASQDWDIVDPLISDNASVTFSDGTVHIGKENVRKAFVNNFDQIKSEEYSIKDVKWLVKDETYAVYLFEYYWSGIISGKPISGNGIGTSVIVLQDDSWKLLTEHLGRKAS